VLFAHILLGVRLQTLGLDLQHGGYWRMLQRSWGEL
jgi:hypothetical protein